MPLYPILIESGSKNSAFGVIVPDLPGCFSAGDTLDEAIQAAGEAATAWIDTALDTGQPIPAPSSLAALRDLPEHDGWSFGVITIDAASLDDSTDRVNIMLPRRVLKRLDAMAKANGESRSGYIAQVTLLARGKVRP